MMNRKSLKHHADLLKLLEHYENMAQCSDCYGQGQMTISGRDGSTVKFSLDSSYNGIKTLEHRLEDISRRHFNSMIKEQIEYIKKQFTVKLSDK